MTMKEIKIGSQTMYYDNHKKKCEIRYANDGLEGVLTEWYEDGKIKLKKTFNNNKLGGVKTFIDVHGIHFRYDVVGGKLDAHHTDWHENGKRQTEATVKNGELNGGAVQWYENGDIKNIEFYKNGEKLS